MGIVKRCELCFKYTNCFLYDKVCENLEFLKNFLDITLSNQIAQYCKEFKREKSERSFNSKEALGNKLLRKCFLLHF